MTTERIWDASYNDYGFDSGTTDELWRNKEIPDQRGYTLYDDKELPYEFDAVGRTREKDLPDRLAVFQAAMERGDWGEPSSWSTGKKNVLLRSMGLPENTNIYQPTEEQQAVRDAQGEVRTFTNEDLAKLPGGVKTTKYPGGKPEVPFEKPSEEAMARFKEINDFKHFVSQGVSKELGYDITTHAKEYSKAERKKYDDWVVKNYGTSLKDAALRDKLTAEGDKIEAHAFAVGKDEVARPLAWVDNQVARFTTVKDQEKVRAEKMSDQDKLKARQAAVDLAEARKIDRETRAAEFTHVEKLGNDINAATTDAKTGAGIPISQTNYDRLKAQANAVGYDPVWKEVKEGESGYSKAAEYEGKKYIITIEKPKLGYQDAEQTVYFDKNGWKHKAEDGKWYTGKPSATPTSTSKQMKYNPATGRVE